LNAVLSESIGQRLVPIVNYAKRKCVFWLRNEVWFMIIDPGKSVGPVLFGASIRDIERLLGTPTSRYDAEEWHICEYEGAEIACMSFRHSKLSSVIIVPTQHTLLWGESLYRLPRNNIEQLLLAHGHTVNFLPRTHPAIRDGLDAPSTGLYFYLENGLCDDVIADEIRSDSA
jgi:hypothetical protein